jgi:hypothetical protein
MEDVAATVAKVSLGPVRSRLPAEPGSATMLARTIGLHRQGQRRPLKSAHDRLESHQLAANQQTRRSARLTSVCHPAVRASTNAPPARPSEPPNSKAGCR